MTTEDTLLGLADQAAHLRQEARRLQLQVARHVGRDVSRLAATAAVALADLTDALLEHAEAADTYTVTHTGCGRPHAPGTPCPPAEADAADDEVAP